MNKRLPIALTMLLCFVMSTFADRVITFNDSGTEKDGNSTVYKKSQIIASGEEYVDTISKSTKIFLGKSGFGLKLGAAKAKGIMTIKLKDACNATAIKYKAAQYSATETTLVVGDNTNESLTATVTEYTIPLTGSAISEITVTSGSKRAYITELTLVEGEISNVAMPSITGTNPFVDSTNVTISCETEGTKIYYTTDGNDPTEESTLYTEPFSIKSSCTVKAIAVAETGKSSVAAKEFMLIPSYDKLSDVNALEENTQFCFTGKAYVVANPNNIHVYLQDETGTSLVYDNTQRTDLAVGSAVTPGWTGTVSVYKGLTEIVPSSVLTAVEGDSKEIVYNEMSEDDIVLEKINTIGCFNDVTYKLPDTGKSVTIYLNDTTEIVAYNNFGLEINAPENDETYNILGVVSRTNDDVYFQPLKITRVPKNLDVSLELAKACNVAAEVSEKIYSVTKTGDKMTSLTVKLADTDGTYTFSKPIDVDCPFSIIGNEEKPVTIDATELEDFPFVRMSETPQCEVDSNGFYKADSIVFDGLNIKNLMGQLFYANKMKYLIDKVSLKNSIVNITCQSNDSVTVENKKNIFDTQNGGVIAMLDIENSTIYANPAHVGTLYSSQSGQKATEAGLDMQTISIKNSTLYNIAYNKNVNSHRQANQKWLTYVLQNSIIFDCGKDGQFVKGLNQGQQGANPVWDISHNSFLRTVNDTIVDHSSLEATGDAEEMVLDNVEDYVVFADVANGNFTLDAGCLQAKEKIGDPRWLVEYDETKSHKKTDGIKNVTEQATTDGAWYTLQGIRINMPSAGIFIHNGKKVVIK